MYKICLNSIPFNGWKDAFQIRHFKTDFDLDTYLVKAWAWFQSKGFYRFYGKFVKSKIEFKFISYKTKYKCNCC